MPVLAGSAAVLVAAALGVATSSLPLLAIAGLGAVVMGAVVLYRPDLATLAAIALIYSNAPVVMSHFHGVPFVVAAAIPFIMLLPIGRDVLSRRMPLVLPPPLPWLLAYLVVLLLSAATSSDVGTAMGELVTFLSEGLLLYVLVTNAVRTREMLRLVTWVLLIVAAGLAGLSLIQALTHNYSNTFFGFAQVSTAPTDPSLDPLAAVTGTPRLAGPIGEENRYAQVLLVVLPMGLMRIWGERSRILAVIAAGLSVLVAVGIALTSSRGAAVAFVLVILIMVALRYIKLRQLAAVGLLVVVVLIAVPQYADRLTSLNVFATVVTQDTGTSSADTSIQGRLTENLAAALVFIDHPILGVGPGLFPNYYYDYAQRVGILPRAQQRQAHDLYLHVLAETGILGFIAFAGVVLVTLRELLRARRLSLLREDSELAALVTGSILSVVAYLTTGIFLHLSFERYFWLMLALAAVASSVTIQALRGTEAPAVTRSTWPAPRLAPARPAGANAMEPAAPNA